MKLKIPFLLLTLVPGVGAASTAPDAAQTSSHAPAAATTKTKDTNEAKGANDAKAAPSSDAAKVEAKDAKRNQISMMVAAKADAASKWQGKLPMLDGALGPKFFMNPEAVAT